jgi:alpha-tubulin suppressor-like RCC1 family protein
MHRVPFLLFTAAAALALVACESSPTRTPPAPAALVVVSGDDQLGAVAAALPQPLVVRVNDTDGQPLPGVSVTWAADPGSGAVSPATAVTDAGGIARTTWTVGTKAGTAGVTATVAGLSPATFTAQVTPGPAAALKITPDSVWLLGPGDTLRLQVQGVDAYQNNIENPVVQWESAAPGVASIDAGGLVRGIQVGSVSITARLGGVSAPAKVFVPGPFTAIATGYTHTCALTVDGHAYCWGLNSTGNLGIGGTTDSSVPVAVASGHRFKQLAAGMQVTCGIATTGVTYCWGANWQGSLGNGTTADSWVPVPVSGSLQFTQISAGPGAGSDQVCGLTAAGAAYCWGDNFSGQLGDGSEESRLMPTAVSGNHAFSAISAGDNHTCGLTAAGAAYCWGSNSSGQLGLPDAGRTCGSGGLTWNCSFIPVRVTGDVAFTAISAGGSFTCATTAAGAAYCWGDGLSGNLGNGAEANSATPVRVAGADLFSRVSAGYPGHACGITTAGAPRCWGANLTGELGTGNTALSSVPVAVAGNLQLVSISSGGQFSCGITPLRQAYCWGANDYGTLGNGTTEQSLVAVQVLFPEK